MSKAKTKYQISFLKIAIICSSIIDTPFQAQPALLYDSVYVFAAALTALDRSHTLKFVNLSCEAEKPWNDGLSLYNYLNSVGFLLHIYVILNIIIQ
jgi:hypothetical protein